MNELQIFNSEEFGEIRTSLHNEEPWFCLADICRALGLTQPSKVKERLSKKGVNNIPTLTNGGTQNLLYINEPNLYKVIFQSRKESAERFTDWVTEDVLPSIRKTGAYSLPQTTDGKIALLAQGYTEMFQKVGEVSDRVDRIENDMPLYGCESDELSAHVKRKVVNLLGGKQSEAYRDRNLRSKLFRAVYTGISSEFGLLYESGRPKSYKNLKRKYLYDAHEYIDTFQVPIYLQEIIDQANSQMRMAV